MLTLTERHYNLRRGSYGVLMCRRPIEAYPVQVRPGPAPRTARSERSTSGGRHRKRCGLGAVDWACQRWTPPPPADGRARSVRSQTPDLVRSPASSAAPPHRVAWAAPETREHGSRRCNLRRGSTEARDAISDEGARKQEIAISDEGARKQIAGRGRQPRWNVEGWGGRTGGAYKPPTGPQRSELGSGPRR